MALASVPPGGVAKAQPFTPERRKYVRRKITGFSAFRLSFALSDDTQLIDVGEGGAAVCGMFSAGEVVPLKFRLPTQQVVRANATVLWASPSGRAGLQFIEPPQLLLQQVRDWVMHGAISADDQQSASRLERWNVLLRPMAELARAATDADGSAIILDEGSTVMCVANAGVAPAIGARAEHYSAIVDPAAWRALGISSMTAVPMNHDECVIGELQVYSRQPGAFDDRHRGALRFLVKTFSEAVRIKWGSAPLGEASAVCSVPRLHSNQSDQIQDDEHPANGDLHKGAPDNATSDSSAVAPQSNRNSIQLVAVAVVIAGIVTVLSYLEMAKRSRLAALPEQTSSQQSPPPFVVNAAPADEGPANSEMPTMPAPAKPSAAISGAVRITSIRNQSDAGSTTVSIELDGPVKFRTGQLRQPDRVYFDLISTAPSAQLDRSLAFNDGLVRGVRLAIKDSDVTRLVLDLKTPCRYQAELSPVAPYRLMVHLQPGSEGAQGR